MDFEVVGDAEVAAALVRADAALDELIAAVADWDPASCDEAMVWVRAAERLGRRGHALALAVQDRVDRSGVHKGDGHASAKVMVRHGANLSKAEALRRQRAVRMGRDLPAVAAAARQQLGREHRRWRASKLVPWKPDLTAPQSAQQLEVALAAVGVELDLSNPQPVSRAAVRTGCQLVATTAAGAGVGSC